MGRFMDMPLPQRLMVVGLLVGFLAFGVYYVFIQDLTDQIATQQSRYKRAMAEYAKLKEFDTPTFRKKMEAEKAEALRKKARFEKMLPEERELPDLIQSVKADADASGLVLEMFDPMKKQVEGPEYKGYRYKVEVTGKMAKVLAFLHSLSGPSKRLVTVHNISMEAEAPRASKVIPEDLGMLRLLLEREKRRQLTPTEEYAKKVLLARQAAKMTTVRAVMDLVAYVYTGGRAAAPTAGAPKPAAGGKK